MKCEISPQLRSFQKDFSNYVFVSNVGEGSFGLVKLFRDPDTDETKIIKIMKYNLIDDFQKTTFLREVQILSESDNPCVMPFLGWSFRFSPEIPCPAIALPYMQRGSVRNSLNLEMKGLCPAWWDSTTKMKVIFGCAQGMCYLHANGIIHRDFKPDNILLDSDSNPIITDFGLSKKITNRLFSSLGMERPSSSGSPNSPGYMANHQFCEMSAFEVGTLNFMAPEMLTDTRYSFPIDVYSYGITIYSIAACDIPYANLSYQEIRKKITEYSLPDFSYLPPALSSLISRCCAAQPSSRPTFRQIFCELYSILFEQKNPENNTNIPPDDFLIDGTEIDELKDYVDSISHEFNEIRHKPNTDEELEHAAQRGDPDAAFALGLMLKKGQKIPKDIVLAQYYLGIAADKGNAVAQRKLGSIYHALGDVYQALPYLQEASEKDAKAARMYGVMLMKGEGCFQDLQKGVEYLKRAADQGDRKALKNVAGIIKHRTKHIKNFGNGLYFGNHGYFGNSPQFGKVSSFGNTDNFGNPQNFGNTVSIGNTVFGSGYSLPDLYTKLVAEGDTESMRKLGSIYLKGSIAPKNSPAGAELLKRAAEKGDAKAKRMFSVCLMTGDGVEMDLKQAVVLLKGAAEQGDPKAMINYGTLLVNGAGCHKNIEKGKMLIQAGKAAQKKRKSLI